MTERIVDRVGAGTAAAALAASRRLRIASALSLIFAAGHLMGGAKAWSPMGPNAVLRAMSQTRFQTMGVTRAYIDFYTGFGWSIGVAMVLQGVLLWQLAGIARGHPALARPMVAAFAAATAASGLIAWRLIFPVPALFSAAILLMLALAFVRLAPGANGGRDKSRRSADGRD